ncbi:MAG TPA: hypothetical protein PK957_04280 [Candidatus Dojkabacteria bacterium]|nr:hypothetical protein [Candidatus Dojkabacteria bacterium]
MGISHTKSSYDFVKPTSSQIPALIDNLERGNNYDWRCINGDLYVDHGGMYILFQLNLKTVESGQ